MEASILLPTLISQISFPQSQDIIRKQFGGGEKKNDHKKQESLMQSGFQEKLEIAKKW